MKTHLGRIGNAEPKNEASCEKVQEPVMCLQETARVSAAIAYNEAGDTPVCMLKTWESV